jgi:glycosyltransferase involved in cell wall biosynthesis
LNFVFFATRWGRAFGGLNAFNQQFAEGLAKVLGDGGQVFCATLDPSDKEQASATGAGVTLVPITGKENAGKFDSSWHIHVTSWLRTNIPGEMIDYWVGHDVISGQVAVEAAQMVGGTAVLVHHMSYHSYQGFKGDAERAKDKVVEQRALFGAKARLFGVGPKLVTSCKLLSAREDVHQLTPGFTDAARSLAVPHDELRAIVFGRLDRDSDIIKQGRLSAAAFGRATKIGRDQQIASFRSPTLHLYGVDQGDAEAFRDLVNREAGGKPIQVLPLPFANDPADLFETLGRANLAMMLSLHDGFGLSGWEAISAEVPLVVGDETGLYQLIDRSLDGAGDAYLRMVRVQGGVDGENFGDSDLEETVEAILAIGRELPRAKKRAARLRALLVDVLGCSWTDTAKRFLVDLGLSHLAEAARDAPAPSSWRVSAKPINEDNRVSHCATLTLDVTQGSTNQDIGLIAEARFGEADLQVEGTDVVYGLTRAVLTLHLEDCAFKGGRLGDAAGASSGVGAWPPNRWRITGPKEDGILSRKALGDDTLCTVETTLKTCGVDLVLSCEKRDINYVFHGLEDGELGPTRARVIGAFLGKCLAEEGSADGSILLSRVMLRIDGDDDAA